MKETHNYYTVINNLQLNLENICESEFISWNIITISSLVNNIKVNKHLTFRSIHKNIDNTYLVKSHSVSIYEHISSNFW